MKVRMLAMLAAPYRRPLFALAVVSIVSSGVMLAIPWLAGQWVGGLLRDPRGSGKLVLLLLGALTALAGLTMASSYLSARTAARLLADLRRRIYNHLQSLPVAFHNERRHGDILALATHEVARLGLFLTDTLAATPARLLTAIGAMVVMFRISASLALLIPLLIPIFYLVLKIVGRRLRGLAVAAQQAEADILATVERNLAMLPAIKSFAREDYESNAYDTQVDRATKLAITEGRIFAVLEPLIGLVAGGAAVLLLFVAGRSVEAGTMTGAQLFSLLFYAALLTRPIGALAHVYGQIQSARGTLDRLDQVLTEQVEPGYAAPGALTAARGALAFDQVSFHYPGRSRLLDAVRITIAAGEKVALVGDNGAGKTTLMNLVLRFIDPDEGIILLDGQDITTLQVQQLRRQIGVVPQHPSLFNGTIRANIAYGLDRASDAAVVHAARLAQAHDFIAALPAGYDTMIGDHGVLLSGGQRQRISLSRALVKDPPILFLDEATSMYDSDGELAFIEASVEALAGRTVLFTAHREASLAIADRILSIADGSVREVGAPVRPSVAAGR